MMKKKKIITMALTGLLTVGMAFAPAAQTQAAAKAKYSKNENIYVRMDPAGDVSELYVVNAFTVKEKGEITDYGDYDSILNLTNLDKIEVDKDEYTFYAEKGKFYYQGNMDNADLPWKFEIQYVLDGKEIEPEELAGAEGDLEIHMDIMENIAAANPAFYPAYLLQVSFTLDNDLCEDIVAEGASMVDAGANQQITFTVMPDGGSGKKNLKGKETEPEGTVKHTELVVSASVTDFEMDDISINGTAKTDAPVSFVSDENTAAGQPMFLMSAEGITIPEEETVETVEEEDSRNYIQKLFDKILHHKED